MRRNIVRFVLVLMTVTIMPLAGRAQGGFTRDGNEALALRLAKAYQASLTRTAGWEKVQKDYQELVRDAALGGPFGVIKAISDEDRKLGLRAREEIELERASRQKLLEFWGRDRAVPPGPARSFAWRYGPLATVAERSVDPNYNKIEYAIRNFRFDPSTPSAPAVPGPGAGGTPPANNLPSRTFTAEKGTSEQWSHIRVTVGNVTTFKTEDQPGWRDNGTGFTAELVGDGRVSIQIAITAKGGVSYYDYNSSVSVRTSDGKVLVGAEFTIPKEGGSKSYAAVWDSISSPGGATVEVKIHGGNPEAFAYSVIGTIQKARSKARK